MRQYPGNDRADDDRGVGPPSRRRNVAAAVRPRADADRTVGPSGSQTCRYRDCRWSPMCRKPPARTFPRVLIKDGSDSPRLLPQRSMRTGRTRRCRHHHDRRRGRCERPTSNGWAFWDRTSWPATRCPSTRRAGRRWCEPRPRSATSLAPINVFESMNVAWNLGIPYLGTDKANLPAVVFRQVIEMATINGARSLGLDAATGSITPANARTSC
jgi:hypothetical protein